MAIAVESLAPTSRRPGAAPTSRDDRALLRLLALRELEDRGPLSGLEVLDAIAPLTRPLRLAPPSYPLLHDLEDDGWVTATGGLPRRYAVTDAGRREAERLALRCWVSVNESIGRYSARVARLLPRGG